LDAPLISILPSFQLVMRFSEDNLMAHLPTFLPALVDASKNRSPYVRKVRLVHSGKSVFIFFISSRLRFIG
jgi:hypothetical protein